ncbi:hypothetical protein [Flavobacterium sp.]|uniref:hypothetical protein n=1 Tax=Flavobacterium sp. TaxID=239 RepID=UPI003F696C3F
MDTKKREYSINLKFDSITIPPFKDILILGTECIHGRLGLEKGFQLLSIDLFKVIEVDDSETVAFIFINNYLLKKIPQSEILAILEENVFPYMLSDETIRLELDFNITVKNIKGSLN